MNKIIKVIIVNIVLLGLFDYFFGEKVLNFFYSKNIIESPEAKRLKATELQKKEKKYRIKHNHFHHTLKKNVNVNSRWGDLIYKTCTDDFGFRKSCKEDKKNNKNNLVIIGDSTTEGLGLNYDKTFAGMLNSYSEKNIINMSVTSYSPIIYLKKIQYYIDNGLKVDEVFVFIDISDIDDETYYFKCKNSNSVCVKNLKKVSDINRIKVEEKNFFPLYEEIKIKTKEIKRKIKPKVYIYRKNYHRSHWTYSENTPKITEGIENAKTHMEELYEYLKNKNIPISIAVYPIPGQILHDVETSKQVKIWKEFCTNRCKHFINLFPIFFKEKNKLSDMDIIKKYYLKNDVHFNELGNKKIFNELLRLKVI